MAFHFKNILGDFLIDKTLKQFKKGKSSEQLPEEKIPQVLELFKNKNNYSKFYSKNLEITKISMQQSVSQDQLITQAIANVNELDKINNMLVKRLREWFSWHYPELSEEITDNKKFAELVLETKKDKNSFGANLDKFHIDEMQLLAKEVTRLYDLREKHEKYLEKVMLKYCPNFIELAGTTIAAKLLELGKSLKHLALLPASTIQLLGAEKALFRHIRTGARSPKHGIIISHPLIQNARKNKRGKAARMLADKLSLCARLDYFHGEFKAPEYKKELEEKLKDN